MSNEEDLEVGHRKLTHRSPSYPGVGLRVALERARAIYERERMNLAPIDVLMAHMGYRPASGLGGVTLAALKKFGLLHDEGSGAQRKARLTDSARRIVLGAEDAPSLIRTCALLPTIHQELWERYSDGLPSRETLRRYLRVERNFNERVVDDLIDEYIDTLEFAGLLRDDTLSNDSSTEESGGHMTTAVPEVDAPIRTVNVGGSSATATASGMRAFALPVHRGRTARIEIPDDLDEADWVLMNAVLIAMKPGMVKEPND